MNISVLTHFTITSLSIFTLCCTLKAEYTEFKTNIPRLFCDVDNLAAEFKPQ